MASSTSSSPKHEPETMGDNGHGKISSSSSNASDYEVIPNSEFYGHPVQIVKVTDERKFELDVEALGNILLRDSIRDTPVVVVSIAGDFRKGKSFMLNHFLRYLQAGCGTADWLADPSAPLKGFSWRGGCARDTTGILMWSEPFVIKRDDGTDVAVVLMDTQGAFDSEYTVKDSATVFALSTMTSSIQVFNLMHNLQEDNLQVLEIFLEYGRLALESVHEKPFQKLIFLIRDWSYPYEHPYGFEGGARLLEKKLELKETMPEQLQRVRRKIKHRVATSPQFDGRTVDYDADFRDNLKTFVPDLLAPGKLIPKEIGGRYVSGRELLEYFKVYINVFAGDTMPEPKTMLEATAEANNLTAVAIIKDVYVVEMEKICGGAQPFINPTHLEAKHGEVMASCMDQFDQIPKMGGTEFSTGYRNKLEEELNTSFEHFAIQNRSKNVFGLFGTPLIMLFACFICLLTSRFLEILGMERISNGFFTLGTVDLGLMIAYVVGRYTGNYPEFITFVDHYAEVVWLFVSIIFVRCFLQMAEVEVSMDQMQTALRSQTTSLISNVASNVAAGGGGGVGGGNSTASATAAAAASRPLLSRTLSTATSSSTPTSGGNATAGATLIRRQASSARRD
ncbi:putative RING-H2 finger protein [Tyrophagus putrescentiae]|nr:putative RING-H2 finger protein [Tyrophagus putrescentiae]